MRVLRGGERCGLRAEGGCESCRKAGARVSGCGSEARAAHHAMGITAVNDSGVLPRKRCRHADAAFIEEGRSQAKIATLWANLGAGNVRSIDVWPPEKQDRLSRNPDTAHVQIMDISFFIYVAVGGVLCVSFLAVRAVARFLFHLFF